MKSFRGGFIERSPVTHGALQSVRALGEYKGRQELFTAQIPQAIVSLQQTATVQSIKSSEQRVGEFTAKGKP